MVKDEEKLKILFHRYNPLDVQVSRRLDKGKYLSMGYGFVKLKTEADCMSVIKTLQGKNFDKIQVHKSADFRSGIGWSSDRNKIIKEEGTDSSSAI